MAEVIPHLLKMSPRELDALFTNSPAGAIPDGEAAGTAIVAPGTTFSDEIAALIGFLAWRGKIFDAKKGIVRNKITPFGLSAVMAKVYKGESWLDGKECIVLDYSKTSLLVPWVRDEMRLIGQGHYLGKVYLGRTRLFDFALQF